MTTLSELRRSNSWNCWTTRRLFAMTGVSSGSFASNAKWLILMSVFQKLVTFTLNQVMVMTTSPEVLGQAAIQLELLLSTLLFLSREGIRMASLRQMIGDQSDVQEIVNISWLPAFIVAIFTTILSLSSEHFFPTYDPSIMLLYCAAAYLECLAEPCYNLFQNAGNIRPRLSAEMLAVTAKSATTVACVAYFDLGVVGFGIAQVVYSLVYCSMLLGHFYSTNHTVSANRRFATSDLLPRVRPTGGYLTSTLLNTALTLTGSSLLKHLLTESDKIALTLTASSYDQGIYAVVNNYGSLAARIIFLPLEDSARLAFAKQVGEVQNAAAHLQAERVTRDPTGIVEAKTVAEQEDITVSPRRPKEYETALLLLKTTVLRLLRLVGFVGLFFAVFGIPYVPVAVQYVLSRQWRGAETTSALRMYCLYLLVMGVNGISEAFVQSAAPPSAFGFGTLNAGLLVSSAGFVAVAVPAIAHWGTSGIILANVVSMAIRICNNGRYALTMFAEPRLFSEGRGAGGSPQQQQERSRSVEGNSGIGTRCEAGLLASMGVPRRVMLSELWPPWMWVAVTMGCVVVTNASALLYTKSAPSVRSTLLHIAVGAVTAAIFLSTSYKFAPAEDVSLVTDNLRYFSRKAHKYD